MKEDKNRLPHKCPNCSVTARTENELQELFGYRGVMINKVGVKPVDQLKRIINKRI